MPKTSFRKNSDSPLPALKLMKILLIFLIASFLNACAEQATRPGSLTSTCVFPNK